MANSNGKITAPVSFADVNYVLGTSHTDLALLCKDSHINKWARFKPVRHSTKGIITISQRYNAWYGFNGNNGIPYITDASRLMNNMVYTIIQAKEMAGSQTYWIYNKPSGGDNTPYRLSDFIAKPNDATIVPWVGSLYGYNHNAAFPVKVSLTGAGVEVVNGIYQVNIQTASTITWEIENMGEDLCVQDFFDWSVVTSSCVWRPVVQLFYPNGTTPWYNVDRPTATAGGTQIAESRSTKLTVSLSTANKVENQLYHACIGIGCTNASASMFPSPNEDLFILPYDINDAAHWTSQFYYPIKFVSYEARIISVTELYYFDDGRVTWVKASGDAPYFTVGANMAQQIRVKMTITKQPNVGSAYFVPEHPSSSAHTPYFYIIGKESKSGGAETTYYLQPTNSSYTNVTEIEIPQGAKTETVTLYATMYTNVARGETKDYHMYSQQGTAGFVHNGYFRITRS